MASNSISTLALKRDRQDQKLALAATKRLKTGRRGKLDATQLPTRYGSDNNADNLVDNDNAGSQVTGRPWT